MSDAPLSSDPSVSDVPVTDLALRPPAEVPVPAEAPEDPEIAELASDLKPAQRQALQLLAGGAGIVQTALKLGVPRRTISRWVNHNPKFIAALNAWKVEQLESGRASALAMTDDVMTTLRTGVQRDSNLAFRMALKMGMLTPTFGPIDAAEVERRHRIRGAQVRDELSQAEYEHNLDLDDRAQRQGIVWASWVPRALTCDEHSLLKFLRDKVAGHASAALILYSKRRLFDLLRQGGVKEDEAMQLLANYRRPYPGFYEPDDLPYAEDEEKVEAPVADGPEQAPEVKDERTDSQDAEPAIVPTAGA
jgi:hypothetical protein